MPRRHPKEDEGPKGPSPKVLAERRQRKKEKRARKSPEQGLDNGLLLSKERESIRLEKSIIKRALAQASAEETLILRKQLDSLDRELKLDQAVAGAHPGRAALKGV